MSLIFKSILISSLYRVVPYSQVGNRTHYTVSRYGALCISNGMADFISTFEIHWHMRVYDKCRSVRECHLVRN